MVIRRIREHVTAHNWFAVSVDVAIVVVGVFLGTQANNWNEARLAANEARTYRERLAEEARANQIDLQARQAYYNDVRQHALAALRMYDLDTSELSEAFVVHSYQASNINSRKLRRSTYDELVASGSLSKVGDQDLRNLAEAFYQGLAVLDTDNQRLPPYRERVRRELPYDVVARIRGQCGDLISESSGTVIFKLPSKCELSLEKRLVRKAVAQLKTAPEMDRDLSRYIVDIDLRIANFGGSERRGRRFLAALERADAAR